MGGAASKDFVGNAPRTTVAKELDELGGYDRPALAKNQSFSARLDWLGAQVGKATEQIEAALSKDEQAGRRELEKEAKRRQLMAIRRGQGDFQMNSQFADFYLRQKQYERPPLSSASILRNGAGIVSDAAAAVTLGEPASPQEEVARRNYEKVATLKRLYSSKVGSFTAPAADAISGSASSGGSSATTSRWRQTVQHAKKTAYLAVGSYVAIKGKKRNGPARIEEVGLYAEQQLGDGMHRFVEEGERLAVARDKLPAMKAELEQLRVDMRDLAAEQEAVLAVGGAEDSSSEGGAQNAENDALDEEAAAAVADAAATAAGKRCPQPKASNRPAWNFGGGGVTHVSGSSIPAKKAKPSLSHARAPDSPASTPASASSRFMSSPPSHASAPLPSVSPPSTASLLSNSRRRLSVNHTSTTQSINGPLLRPNGAAAAASGAAPQGSVAAPMRATWSGTPTAGMDLLGSGAAGAAGAAAVSDPDSGRTTTTSPLPAQASGPLRPSRPGASLVAGAATGVVAPAAPRPKSAMRSSLMPRPPAEGPTGKRRVVRVGDPQRAGGALGGKGSGEYRIGTMAQRVFSRILFPPKVAAKQQLRALREAETNNVLQQQQLLQAIQESAAELQTASGMLRMYCNRANGRWVEQQQWALPPVHEATMPSLRRQVERYKEVVLKDLRQGRVAVQIHVDDDLFTSSRIGTVPLWSLDPWHLLSLSHPARTDSTAHLVGLSMGVRQLLALATAVESLAGAEAVSKMPVVLACHEGQVDEVVKDLAARKMCRFSADNVIIMVQQRTPGHSYDPSKRAFAPAPEAPLQPAGSGYALLALGWAGADTFRLSGPDLSVRTPLELSTLDLFTERGVQWLSSWRLRDLAHYSPESCLNLEQLALSYALADSQDANMSVQVELVDSLQGINRIGSGIVLSIKDRPPPPPTMPTPATTVSSNAPILRRIHESGNRPPSRAFAPGPSASFRQRHSLQAPHAPHTLSPLRHPHSAPPAAGSPAAGPAGQRAHPGLSQGSSRKSVVSAGPRVGGIGSEGGPLSACDVKWSDVMTPALTAGFQQLVDSAAVQTGSQPRLAVSIKRYVYHVPSLKELLSGPSIFRPCIGVGDGGYVYVTFDASDITAQPSARCVAVSYTPRPSPTADSPSTASPLSPTSSTETPKQANTPGAAAAAPADPAVNRPASAIRLSNGALATPTTGPALPQPKASSAGGARNASAAATPAMAAAALAAAALQRGRLLSNDSDLDTLLWVAADQDNNAAFRASVSATNSARSRVTAHAAGGLAAAGAGGPGRSVQQHVIVLAVADDAACQLAVRVAMAIMKPGADCLHVLTIAKDPSVMALSTAKNLVERFKGIASATLGDIKSVVQVKRHSVVEDIVGYADNVGAALLVTGSMSLAAAPGSSVVGSVALSVARECNRPILVVKPTARLAESAYEVGKKPCLRAAVCAEPSCRPLVRFVVSLVLDGGRGDKLVLVRGKAFDKEMKELASSRRVLDHLAEEATAHRRFHSSLVVRRMVAGAFEAEHPRVVDADQCHIVAVQVPDGRGPLPSGVLGMLRTSRSAVLLYRTCVNTSSSNVATSGADGQAV